MRILTINLTDEAYQALRSALEQTDRPQTVTEWIETELNDNTEVIIEMLQEDF